MYLTDEEKRMLAGEKGEAAQTAMEILQAIGKVYDAEKMIPITSAHVAGLSLKSHGIAGMEWAEGLAAKGARVVVPTGQNVIGVDRSRDLGFPEDWTKNQLRINEAYRCMGCYALSTCVPYYCGFVPKKDEHIAWAESSAVIFTNSVLGVRDNREGGPSAIAAGIVGRTPYYGLHLDENRRGDFLFKVEAKIRNQSDYGALGSYVGKMVGNDIPVFEGLTGPCLEDLVYLGAALASSGGVAMFHAIGYTPEAPTLEKAFSGKKYDTVLITDKEIELGRQGLTSAKDKKVDYVAVGCPHYSVGQIREVAELINGRKVHKDVTFWVHTNVAIKHMARQLGYTEIIEKAGGLVTQDLCTVLGIPECKGFRTLATNSAKMAFYAPGSNSLGAWYGSIEQCVDAAVNGYWGA